MEVRISHARRAAAESSEQCGSINSVERGFQLPVDINLLNKIQGLIRDKFPLSSGERHVCLLRLENC
jgi:hypothetical protein